VPLSPAIPSALIVIHLDMLTKPSYDTQPSILTLPITSSSSRAASDDDGSKRAKLTPPAGSTITTLIEGGSYDSLGALEKDVETATSEILAGIGSSELSTVQPLPEDDRLQAKVLAFRKIVKTLVTREEARRAHLAARKQTSDDSADQDGSVRAEEAPESRTVLTLFGSAQGPKQLFSSLQQPRSIPASSQPSILDSSVKITLPLRESTLPNIISTTEVYPLPDDSDDKKKEIATIGKLFKAPSNLPQLSPPKLAKPLTTKGSLVTFAPPEVPKPSRKGSHSFMNQNLSAGFWLGYGGVDMPKDPTSPTAKQKSRQRALSTGEAQQPPSMLTLAAVKHAKEDALFRSAYSSFAPTRDNASAVVPEETKNMVWWQKVGQKRFNEVFPIDPELLGLGDPLAEDIDEAAEDGDDALREAAESFEPIEGYPLPEPEERDDLDKSTDEVLQEISELLETLASHQRIRNSSLATNPRTPVIQNSSLASLAGSPSTPSVEEFDVYSMLKSQLTLMITQLPPYAVAKLNGDQLEELNISRTILVENKEVRGVLEEDQHTRTAKQPTAAMAATPSLSRMASGTSLPHYPSSSTQYARPSSALQSGARPVQTSTSYYPQQQSVHRSPSVQYPRTSSGTTQGYQTPAASFTAPPRQTYTPTQAFGQQTARSTYAQGSTGYFSQRPTQATSFGGAAASQYYGSTPQTQTQNRYPQQAQNGYYQRPQNVAPMYGATPSAQARTASPLKAAPAATQNYAAAGQNFTARPAYSTTVSGGQVRSTYYPPSQYGTAQPHTSTAAVTPGFNTTAQQIMMSREQVQAAQQPQARLAAQNSFTRQGSGTPQPPANGNGQFGGQPNGASMVT
jgi:hypothetical protein